MVQQSDAGDGEDAGPYLNALLAHISKHVPADRAPVVRSFAAYYVHRLSDETLGAFGTEELFAQVMGVFDLADGRRDDIAVRGLNPTLAADGYRSAGSVIETNTADSPFLFDSATQLLQARSHTVQLAIHPVMGIERAADGRIARVFSPSEPGEHESIMHLEIERHLHPEALIQLTDEVVRVLTDVRSVVEDFGPMREATAEAVEIAQAAATTFPADEVEETTAFLRWLLNDNFVFLGVRDYETVDTPEGQALQVIPGSGLGILRDTERSSYATPVLVTDIDPALRKRFQEGLLVVSKTNSVSEVHRRARMDYIGVRRTAPDRQVVGERRILGLFTSKAYMEPNSETPLVRRKFRRVLRGADLIPGSHDYKAAVELLESFPKDELFVAPVPDLRKNVIGLLKLQEQQHIGLFVRRDIPSRSVSLMVAMPRDRFNARRRKELQDLFMARFHGTGVDYHLALTESDPALVYFTVHVGKGDIPDVPIRELEEEVVTIARTWDDRLRELLEGIHGRDEGRALAEKWAPRLPEYYKSSTDLSLAAIDVGNFERLESSGASVVVGLQNERSQEENLTRLGIYRTGGKIRLSDIMPILEDLGLEVVEEVPTQLLGDGSLYLHDFGVLGPDGRPLKLSAIGDRIEESILAVWNDQAQSDTLNRLVVAAGLTWRQVRILRAYRTYRQRVNASFTEAYQSDILVRNQAIATKLVRLFELRFDPSEQPATGDEEAPAEQALHDKILEDLDAVRSLDEDRVLRSFLGMILATIRTNAYLPERRYLSFKIESARVPDMPRPYPRYEIFVFSPDMEAIHLRGGKVARGGIRWSDRLEDYRTEVLGLMKAQRVKNAVIVPTGSKGGFVLKRPPADPAALPDAVRTEYVTFMRGLLDITDNRKGGEVVHPDHVRVLDDEDPYLVVAADKGTATFSDTANTVAEEHGFWLGDAFASGGSSGFDHKRMGITARGAWESVRRHFRELGMSMREPFTAVGVGDMSGDVFGNGMLLSEQIKLVAAFDHRNIFIDPSPDPATSFAERKRLFELPRSSWNDYDRSVLSPGGAVYSRADKKIRLSPEARQALGLDGDDAERGAHDEAGGQGEALPPNEVIRAILRAPVDLLFNGGIGTYVKASAESDGDAGDRTNDAVRINASELRARVVGEGGNLGFTQRARIEYAVNGGRIFTDFIDNSAGVDTSDHEVNLKILLGLAETRGDLTRKQRDDLIRQVTEDVAAHVLYDNFLQAQILSQEVRTSVTRVEAYEALMASLEDRNLLERDLEALPTTEEMSSRRKADRGMATPELAVLLAYSKINLTGQLVRSVLPDDPYFEADLGRYFPGPVTERFRDLLPEHPLRRELVATIVANEVVNSMGSTFVTQLLAETGAEPSDVARAYRIARDVSGASERWSIIEGMVDSLDPEVQNELLSTVDRMVEVISRWYLAHPPAAALSDFIPPCHEAFERLAEAIPRVGSRRWRAERDRDAERLEEAGVSEEIARRHAYLLELVHAPDIIEVASETDRDVEEVARAFFLVGEAFHIDRLESAMERMSAGSRWQRWAMQALEDDLLRVRRDLAETAIREGRGRPIDDAVDTFLGARAEAIARLDRFMRSLSADPGGGLAALSVAVRQIRAVA
jgi:glutamate dehydrogenase